MEIESENCGEVGEDTPYSMWKVGWIQWECERHQIFSGWKWTPEFAEGLLEGLLEPHDPQLHFYYTIFKDR